MLINKYLEKSQQGQVGAVLVLSLIILAVLSVIGVSSMHSSDAQRLQRAKVAHNTAILFEAAEAALKNAEASLLVTPSPLHKPEAIQGVSYEVAKACHNSLMPLIPWKEKMMNSWRSVQQDHPRQYQLSPYQPSQNKTEQNTVFQVEPLKAPVQYAIDFLCFMPALEHTALSLDDTSIRYYPTYQITALARDNNGVVRIALQSTFRLMADMKKSEKAKGLRVTWRELTFAE